MRRPLLRLLALVILALATLAVSATAPQAQSTPVVRLTDVPGKWFDPSVMVVPVGGAVQFRTTTFAGTFTSALFPCTPTSIADGTCSVSNPASFPAGFPFDQADPLVGSVTVTFPVAGIYVFADKVHPYAIGVVVATDATHPLTAKQRALLNFVSQHQLFLNQDNWIRYRANQLKRPTRRGVGEVWVDTQFESVPGQNTYGTVTVVRANKFRIRMKVDGTALCGGSDCHGVWNNPHNNWTSDDERSVYVTHWFDHVISKVDRQTGKIKRTGSVGSSPAHVITSPGDGSLWASVMGENYVKKLDPNTLQVIDRIQTGAAHTHPHGPWFTPDGRLMIVPNSLADTAGILIFDTGTGTLLKEIPVGFEPLAVGITPDGEKAYLSNGFDATLDVLDLDPRSSNYLTVTKSIDISNGTPGPNEFPGAFDEVSLINPFRIPIQTPVSPDGRFVLTATLNLLGEGAIEVVDTSTDTLVKVLPCEPGCHGANFGAKRGGGFYGYVTNQFTNALEVVDVDPAGGGLPRIAGKVFLGRDGIGGQGVLPIPIAYEGWIERAVARHARFVSLLTPCQRHPIRYVTAPDICPPGA
jgi:DNA-binding beta-propeller fold protein YncE